MNTSEPAYPIRIVAELTGVAPATLRAWERRYGRPVPQRTASGHRLYSREDVAAIRDMRERVAAGESPALAARTPPLPAARPADAWDAHRRRLLSAIERFDPAELDRVYNDLLALFRVDVVTERLLRPVIEQLGTRWSRSGSGIAEEHFFTSFLRNKLGARLHHAAPHLPGARLVTACLPGEPHELGVLLFGLAASGLGYRLLHLGANLPIDQAGQVVRKTGADGLLLSGTTVTLDDALLGALRELASTLDVPVAIGGQIAERERARLEAAALVVLGTELEPALDALTGLIPPRVGSR